MCYPVISSAIYLKQYRFFSAFILLQSAENSFTARYILASFKAPIACEELIPAPTCVRQLPDTLLGVFSSFAVGERERRRFARSAWSIGVPSGVSRPAVCHCAVPQGSCCDVRCRGKCSNLFGEVPVAGRAVAPSHPPRTAHLEEMMTSSLRAVRFNEPSCESVCVRIRPKPNSP